MQQKGTKKKQFLGNEMGSKEQTTPIIKNNKAVRTKLLKTTTGLGWTFLFIKSSFGKELVCKAD